MYAKSSQVDKKISRAGLARVFNITTSDTRKRLKPSVTCLLLKHQCCGDGPFLVGSGSESGIRSRNHNMNCTGIFRLSQRRFCYCTEITTKNTYDYTLPWPIEGGPRYN